MWKFTIEYCLVFELFMCLCLFTYKSSYLGKPKYEMFLLIVCELKHILAQQRFDILFRKKIEDFLNEKNEVNGFHRFDLFKLSIDVKLQLLFTDSFGDTLNFW